MLELISLLASLAILIVTPIQTAQICAGKINPKFKGTPEAYVASFRKQIGLLVWLGLVFAVLNVGLIFISTEPGDWIFHVIAAALWLGVFVVSFFCHRRLARLPTAAPGGGAST